MLAVLPIVCLLLDMVTSYRGVFTLLRSLVSYLAAGIMRRSSVPRAWAGFLESATPQGVSCLGPHAGLKMQQDRFERALAALTDLVAHLAEPLEHAFVPELSDPLCVLSGRSPSLQV